MARYGIRAARVFGVPIASMRTLARRHAGNHELALALWESGWQEARILAALIDDPARVTASQMDRWCRDFENWAVCDTVCIRLFRRTPHAWRKVAAWSDSRREFTRRAAFALLASLVVYDKRAPDAPFVSGLRLVERASTDERHFVRKSVNWALRTIGARNAKLRNAAITIARRLAASPDATPRWIGKDALRVLVR